MATDKTSDKFFWIRFCIKDWRQDTRILSASARGVWIELIASVFPKGSKTLSEGQWIRELGVTQAEFQGAIEELRQHGIADIHQAVTGEVTVVSRRLVREEKARTDNALRQERFRSNAKVTQEVTGMSQTKTKDQSPKTETKTREKDTDRKDSLKGNLANAVASPSAPLRVGSDKIPEGVSHLSFSETDAVKVEAARIRARNKAQGISEAVR